MNPVAFGTVLTIPFVVSTLALQDQCSRDCYGINALLDELPYIQSSTRLKRVVASYLDERSCQTDRGDRGFRCDEVDGAISDQELVLRQHTDKTCGRQRVFDGPRVTTPGGGAADDPGTWPWMVSYGRREIDEQAPETTRWVHLCGGSIVSVDVVLTAAHCYNGRDLLWVRVGDTDLSDSYDDGGALDVAVASVARHPRYKPRQAYYDVALLKLKTKLVFSDFVVPVCLPEAAAPYDNVHQGQLVTLTGWGLAARNAGGNEDYLQRIHLGIFSQQYCNDSYNLRESHNLYQSAHGLVPNLFIGSVICAGYEHGGLGSCKGDSGGPLVRFRTHTRFPSYEQVGVVSGGIGRCGDRSFPGVYVRLDEEHTLDFIRRGIGMSGVGEEDTAVRDGTNGNNSDEDGDGDLASTKKPSFCFVRGRCTNSFYLDSWPVADPQYCLRQCQATRGCKYFTFFGSRRSFEDEEDGGGLCSGFADCVELERPGENGTCAACVSGQVTCKIESEESTTKKTVSPSSTEESLALTLSLLGGYADGAVLDRVDVVTAKGSCTSRIRMPERRTRMFAGEVKEAAFVMACGGILEGTSPGQQCYKLRKGNSFWEFADPMPESLALAANAAVGKTWFVVSDNAVYSYDEEEGWTALAREVRGGERGCAVAVGNGFLLTGGHRTGFFTGEAMRTSSFFNADSLRWDDDGSVKDMNEGRALHGCALVDDLGGRGPGVLVVGGYNFDEQKAVKSTEFLPLDKSSGKPLSLSKWERLGDLKERRYGVPVVGALDGRVVVTGGVALGLRRSFKTVEELVVDADGTAHWEFREGLFLQRGKGRYAGLAVPTAYFGTCKAEEAEKVE